MGWKCKNFTSFLLDCGHILIDSYLLNLDFISSASILSNEDKLSLIIETESFTKISKSLTNWLEQRKPSPLSESETWKHKIYK